jgi:pyrroloquinoline quinone biosynthesis protein B
VEQTNYLREQFGHNNLAIFLTHAHMGHYSGLIHLGREAANTHKVPVYAMNRMFKFLSNNGPWDQLIQLENIELRNLQESLPVTLENGIVMTPVLVPHRDEYSETVGYYIKGQSKTALYIPDIDKWSAWEQNILSIIPSVDYAFIDGTFYKDGEVPRPMAEVPHPFISESVQLLKHLAQEDRNKVHFIHLNHSNPTRNKTNPGRIAIEASGFRFAEFGQRFTL